MLISCYVMCIVAGLKSLNSKLARESIAIKNTNENFAINLQQFFRHELIHFIVH